ncbi:MAG: opioid growth factor receptor-related protein [Oculatellaceae cyanobacterium Prado106]|jgi:hypothetical protein|nr:opioid growth factor receptor-related protein [Oculatellaceae cyanobacterium Prado106]
MNPEQLTERLIPFYLGEESNTEGRMIQEIWAWDFEALESVHNYIQWLFPIAEKSMFNRNAPVVDEAVMEAFGSDERLRGNLRRSLIVLLKFYGLELCENGNEQVVVDRSDNYQDRIQAWVYPFDHNYLRITRILKCLMAFGMEVEAQAFYGCLCQIYQENQEQVGEETFWYWTDAVESGRDGIYSTS